MRGTRAHQGRRSCDTRAATSNAAPFTRELSFTAAPPAHGLVGETLHAAPQEATVSSRRGLRPESSRCESARYS